MHAVLPLNHKDFIKKAMAVAPYYGFAPLETVIKKYSKNSNRKLNKPIGSSLEIKTDTFGREMANILERCKAHNISPETSHELFYHSTVVPQDKKTATPAHMHFNLVTLGVQKSIAEALLLRTTGTILKENGLINHCVHINSIGDKDSGIKFTKELQAYLRKNISDIPVSTQTVLKKDVFHALSHLRQKRHPLYNDAPKSIEFLSSASRKYFQGVLEYLEGTEVSYSIDPRMVGNKDYYRETVFEIRDTENETDGGYDGVLARGGRCDEIARRIYKVPTSIVGITLTVPWKGRVTKSPLPQKRGRRPKFFFVQLGMRAKQQSLGVIELLRKENIPIHQSICEDTLSGQLEQIKELQVPYAILMGQKETMDETVIVRNVDTQIQEIVPVETLPSYLKQISL